MNYDVYNGFSKDQQEKSKLINSTKAKHIIFPAGRRYGKGEFALRKQFPKILKMQSDPQSPHAWIGPIFRQAKLGFHKYCIFLKSNNIPYKAHESDLYIDIFKTSKYRINFFSADRPENMEGFAFRTFVVDESGIALARRNVWENSIQPATIDFNAWGMFIGTPKGKGLFEEMYMKGKEGHPDFLNLHATSYANSKDQGGYLDREAIDRIANDMPELVRRQEIEAEFIGESGGVFRNVVAAAKQNEITDEELDALKQKGYHFVMGCDWGKHNDFTVLSTICIETKTQISLDRFNKIDYVFQIERLKACYERFRHIVINAESNSMGEGIIEQLERDGLPVTGVFMSNPVKKNIIENLSIAIEKEELTILNNQDLIFELQSYEMKRTPSGLISYNAPDGYHDDTVISLALAYSGLEPKISFLR